MKNWYQQTLTTPTVLEVNIRLGVIPEQDHAQVMAEIVDPTTGVLLGQWSTHHAAMRDVPRLLVDAMDRATRWLDDAIEPF